MKDIKDFLANLLLGDFVEWLCESISDFFYDLIYETIPLGWEVLKMIMKAIIIVVLFPIILPMYFYFRKFVLPKLLWYEDLEYKYIRKTKGDSDVDEKDE